MKFIRGVIVLLISVFYASASLAQYQVNGNAVQTGCGCYQLTPNQGGQSGSVWNVNLIDLSNPFNFAFDVFLGCGDGGADGLAFVLQPLSVNAGSSGGGIGYAGISPSLAIEMDTYQNNTDPSYDHMALQTNGSVSHGTGNTLAGPIQTSATSGNVEDCAWHLLQVSWDPAAQTFTVWFDGTVRMTYNGNIIDVFGGNPQVYWGFTAATGGASNQHQFCNTLNPNFNVTPASQCVGFPVQFNSTSVVSTGQITGFVWDFGDGNTGTGANPTHTYTSTGNFTATLTITSEGCTESFSTPVTINPIPTANVGADVPICVGDGVQVTPSNIDATATYSWSPATGVSNPNVPNPMIQTVTTQTYVMTVTNSSGCQASDDIIIIVNPEPVANAGADQIICAGEAATLSGSGGAFYSWTPTTDLTTPTSSSTSASPASTTVYQLTVTDENNCQATDEVTVNVNPLPSVNAGTDATICPNETHQLTGSGAVDYSWSPAIGLDDATIANPMFSGLSSSNYVLTGTDANGCENTAAVMINVNPLPAVNAGSDVDICIGDGVGVTAVGAASYVWSPANDLNDPNIDNPTFTGASTTTLTVTGTDANGCVNTDQVTITVNPLPVVNAGNDASVCDGSPYQLNAVGATSYVWSPAGDLNNPNVGNPIFSGLADATLTVTGTDANGCVDTDAIDLTIAPLPVVDAGTDASICAQETIQLGASGASTYAWTPATGLDDPTIADPVLTASTTTTFTVTGIDALGCSNTDQVTITVFTLPQAVIDVIGDACLGNASFLSESSVGNILIYDWDLGDNTTAATATLAHTYTSVNTFPVTLTVTDDNGCQDSDATTAVVLPLPVVSMNIPNSPDFCVGETISFENTSPEANVGVSWNFTYQPGLPPSPGNSSSQSNPQFSYQNFGTYNVRLIVLSDVGCVNSAIESLNIHAIPEANFSFDVVCEGSATTFNDLSTLQGNSAINGWQWNYDDGSPVAYGQNPVYPYPLAGSYDVELIVQTDQGCRDTVVQNIWVHPTPVISISGTDVCFGAQTEFTNASTPQDATILNWTWDFDDTQTATGPAATHDYATHGNYTVSLTALSDSGCTATGTTLVRVFPNPETEFLVLDPEGCEPHEVGFYNTSVIASGGIASYSWTFGNGEQSQLSAPTAVYADTIGIFDVTLTAVSDQGCETVVVQQGAVTVHVTPQADFTQSADVISIDRPRVDFTDASQDAVTYQWDFGNGSTSTAPDPFTSYMEPGEYPITLTVTNGMCEDMTESTILVKPIFTFYIPSAFTPDNNGHNEVFIGQGEGYVTYQFFIFDRWGKIIFQSNSDQLGWDGTYQNTPVQAGIYTYQFILTNWYGDIIDYEGGVTLLR